CAPLRLGLRLRLPLAATSARSSASLGAKLIELRFSAHCSAGRFIPRARDKHAARLSAHLQFEASNPHPRGSLAGNAIQKSKSHSARSIPKLSQLREGTCKEVLQCQTSRSNARDDNLVPRSTSTYAISILSPFTALPMAAVSC